MHNLGEKRALSILSILQAIKILADSWEAVTKETVISYSKKSGINLCVHQATIADPDDLFKDLQENLSELKSADP